MKLTSNGGFVNYYGFAASQLNRLKSKNIKITASVDLIAASGGYLMVSVADKIIASNFAIIGSIGTLGIVPNFYKLLKKHDIDIEHHTSGSYKSTLNILSKNTDIGRIKFIKNLNRTQKIFKDIIKKNRSNLNIDEVSTGEYWYAVDAINYKLVDKIQTSDEFIFENLNKFNIYEITNVSFSNKKSNKIISSIFNILKKNV